jgi:hypothetical protein
MARTQALRDSVYYVNCCRGPDLSAARIQDRLRIDSEAATGVISQSPGHLSLACLIRQHLVSDRRIDLPCVLDLRLDLKGIGALLGLYPLDLIRTHESRLFALPSCSIQCTRVGTYDRWVSVSEALEGCSNVHLFALASQLLLRLTLLASLRRLGQRNRTARWSILLACDAVRRWNTLVVRHEWVTFYLVGGL